VVKQQSSEMVPGLSVCRKQLSLSQCYQETSPLEKTSTQELPLKKRLWVFAECALCPGTGPEWAQWPGAVTCWAAALVIATSSRETSECRRTISTSYWATALRCKFHAFQSC